MEDSFVFSASLRSSRTFLQQLLACQSFIPVRRFIRLVQTKEVVLWAMAASQTAENREDEISFS